MLSDFGRKPEHPKETHAYSERSHKLHTSRDLTWDLLTVRRASQCATPYLNSNISAHPQIYRHTQIEM